jgi:hypothetical protein
MVAPAPPQAPAQPPPQQQAQLAGQVAQALAGAATVAGAAAILAAPFAAIGIRAAALRAALSVLMSYPPPQLAGHGPATEQTGLLNLVRRAQFLIIAAGRIQADLTRATSLGESQADALAAAGTRERRFYAQHLAASHGRMVAAAQVDAAASVQGRPLLGWNTVHDALTSAECRAADGRNFRADRMPLIGWPGAVHPHCRCWPGPPRRGARLLP